MMKKNLFLLIAIVLLAACSTKKNGIVNRTYHNFTTYYNTLFNGKEALQSELNAREKAHKDDFYQGYITLLPFEESSESLEKNAISDFTNSSQRNVSVKDQPQSPQGASSLEIAEAKALKAIAKHSMVFNGEEKNKEIFNAYELLVRVRLYQKKYNEALDAINTAYNKMPKDKRLPLIKIYEGVAYSKLKDNERAHQIFTELTEEKNLKKETQKILALHYSEMLLRAGKKEASVEQLEKAFALNKNKKLRSRIAFLRGQILADLGRKEEARESFVTAFRNANDFEFEVKSQIEIAKTYSGNIEEYEEGKKYIENIRKKGTNASRKNEFYYALALMANKVGKNEEAIAYLNQSIKEKMSDPQIRGLAFYEKGKVYFDKEEYLSAGAYYDSAVAVMNHEPSKIELQKTTKNIKDLSKNYYLIKKNDSILALAKMGEPERTAYFNKYINQLKEKEAKKEALLRKEEINKGLESNDFPSSGIFANNSGTDVFSNNKESSGKFYFANQATIAKGEADFRRIWGTRTLGDNWRYSTQNNNIQDLKKEAMGQAAGPDPRRFQPEYYIEQIPKDSLILSALKKDRDTASLGMGRMYHHYLGNTKLATKTLYDLVDQNPEKEVKLQALYQIFSMNYEKEPQQSERAKNIILNEFPYTSYAEFVKNPKNSNFSTSSEEVRKAYEEAYQLYADGKFEESKTSIQQSLQKYTNDALIPKFELLNAFNTGKTVGKEVMILQLEQIALNYGKTQEGIKAKELLQKIKSDLEDVEKPDNSAKRDTPSMPVSKSEEPEIIQQKIPQKMQQNNPMTPPKLPKREKPF